MKIWVLSLLLLLAVQAFSEELVWDRFRGPNGAGVSSASNIPEEFGPDKNVVWRTPLPKGFSSPVFGSGSIFLTGYEGDKLITLSLDRESGRIKWRREVIRDRAGPLRDPNSPASPSAATDSRNVYVFFQDFGLLGYGPDGNELWRVELGPFNNQMGLGSSPVYVNGKIIQVCDSETESFIVAIDAASGETIWRLDRPYSLRGYASPVVYQPKEAGPQVLVAGSYELSAYDVDSGDKVWWVEGLTWQLKPTPVLDDEGYAYVLGWAGSADLGQQEEVPSYGEMLLKRDQDKDGKLSREELLEDFGRKIAETLGDLDLDLSGYLERRDWEHHSRKRQAVNAVRKIRLGGHGNTTEGAVQWLYYKSLPNVPSPLFYDSIVYLVKDGGIFTALSAEDGRVLRQGRLRGAMGRYFSSPVAADGKIFTADETGMVSVIQPGPEWSVIRSINMQEEVYATPVIMDGRLFIRTQKALYCFAN